MANQHGTWWTIFDVVRRTTIFGLGVWIIVAALDEPESGNTISMLVIGMVMVGVLPIQDLYLPWRNDRRERYGRDRRTATDNGDAN